MKNSMVMSIFSALDSFLQVLSKKPILHSDVSWLISQQFTHRETIDSFASFSESFVHKIALGYRNILFFLRASLSRIAEKKLNIACIRYYEYHDLIYISLTLLGQTFFPSPKLEIKITR